MLATKNNPDGKAARGIAIHTCILGFSSFFASLCIIKSFLAFQLVKISQNSSS
jgi:hypothetical protein